MMLDAFFAATLPKWYLVGPFLLPAGAPRGVGPHFPESLARPPRGWEFWEGLQAACGESLHPSFPPQAAQDAGICNPGTPGGASSLPPFSPPTPPERVPLRGATLFPLWEDRDSPFPLTSGWRFTPGKRALPVPPARVGRGGQKEAFPLRRTSGFLCPRGRSRAPSPPPQVGPPTRPTHTQFPPLLVGTVHPEGI